MRLLNFLKLSCKDDNINKFRAVDIKLVESFTPYKSIIEETSTKYELNNSILEDLNKLNKELKKVTKNYIFDFCLDENSLSLYDVVKNKRKAERLQKYMYEINDKFNNIKVNLENKLSK